MKSSSSKVKVVPNKRRSTRRDIFRKQLEIQSMVLPCIIFLIIFAYVPMFFSTIAFQDYNIVGGMLESPWVGLKHFTALFTDRNFFNTLKNTFGINFLGLLIGFPAPIIFALMLNELRVEKFKKTVQTVTYIPYFFSWAVYGGIVLTFLSPSVGALNAMLIKLGFINEGVNYLANPNYFWTIAVVSSLLKDIGYSSIIYIAAIAGVDPTLYEAARVDGASKLKVIRYVTIPCIAGTIVIMLIFKIAGILSTGLEQIMVLQNVMNITASETLDTYVYKVGLEQMNFSYATAVGLFKSVVAVTLLWVANATSKKITDKGLF